MSVFNNVNIGLFITGGIASYKMAELTRQFIKQGANVKVAMTKSAAEFITPLTFQVLTKHAVLVDVFDEHEAENVQHVHMADWCDLVIVAPATANILAKMAYGIADEIVSTTLLATTAPRLIVPAMNVNMYENPATQNSIKQLRQYGYTVMEPDTGFLAEGYSGKGRLPELERIVEEANLVYTKSHLPQTLQGKKVLVSAGGTVERIDPVRYISNDSSGQMGYSMAKAAEELGADVTVISTRPNLPVSPHWDVHYVESARQLQEQMASFYDEADYVVMAAAVSDYRVKNQQTQKMKKEDQQEGLAIELVENPDILKGLGEKKTHQTLIGFAAETQDLLVNAKNKLERKKADWLIANDVSRTDAGFNVSTNQVTILGKDGSQKALPLLSKEDTARQIWQHILTPLEEK
ncbi:bifunctional phosphopantothenoylcysteine decarboxylase/phosphopantothenate--cysteine ligase CoaBC [Dolosicoccus paucivorans]